MRMAPSGVPELTPCWDLGVTGKRLAKSAISDPALEDVGCSYTSTIQVSGLRTALL